jgi:Na+/alanine symporter
MEEELIEKTIFTEIPTEKIYKERAIWVGTFLGGPLVAGYLIAENFKVFNENEKAKITWIIAIVTTIVIFGGLSFIPENVKIPNQIIPIVYTVIASSLAKRFQEQKSNEYIENGGKYYSWWRIIAIGIIGLLLSVCTFICIDLFVSH